MNLPRRVRILIIEDDESLRDSLRDILSDIFDVETAVNGIEGVKAILQNHFDLVLTDIKMPGLDGHQTIDIIRSNEPLKSLPILIISGHSLARDFIQKNSAKGVIDFMQKPFEIDALFLKIRNLIALAKENSGTHANNFYRSELGFSLNIYDKWITKGSMKVILSQTEVLVLNKLVENHGELVLRTDLIQAAWSSEEENTKVINAHMVSLKQKIKPLGLQILTVYGKGYRLAGWTDKAA